MPISGPSRTFYRQLGHSVFLGFDDVVGTIVPDDVALARQHAGKTRRVVRQRTDHDLIEIGAFLVPIIRIAVEHDAIARLPRFQPEWTRADGVAVVPLLHLPDGLGRVDDVVDRRRREDRREVWRWIL